MKVTRIEESKTYWVEDLNADLPPEPGRKNRFGIVKCAVITVSKFIDIEGGELKTAMDLTITLRGIKCKANGEPRKDSNDRSYLRVNANTDHITRPIIAATQDDLAFRLHEEDIASRARLEAMEREELRQYLLEK